MEFYWLSHYAKSKISIPENSEESFQLMQTQYLKGSKALTIAIFLTILGLLTLLCLSHFFSAAYRLFVALPSS